MTNSSQGTPIAVVLAATLLAAGLAGCVGSDADASARTFDEARDAAHTTAQPTGDGTLRLGLIEPTSTDSVEQGITNVTLVLWDQGTGEPVTEAEVTLDAHMPAMGHGTDPETDPTHVANGVYRGSTNLMMGGQWLLKINATDSDGGQAHFEVPVEVAGGGHGGMHHGGPSTSFDSYEDAKSAEGPTLEPEANSPYRLKVLEPSTTGVATGQTNVTVLVYDSEADEPVTSGNASLNATMPAMGHGTSPEEDPVHADHGVWKGLTTFSMNGTWILNLDVKPANASWQHFETNVTVGNATGGHDHGAHDHGNATDGPAFEPYTEVFEGNISETGYSQTHTATVKTANATATMNATLENATPLTDDVTVTLFDAGGEELGSISLDADSTSGQLVVDEVPTEGDYDVEVTGQAVDAHYVVELHVAPP